MTGMPYADLYAALNGLSRETRDRLNAIAYEMLDDARAIEITR